MFLERTPEAAEEAPASRRFGCGWIATVRHRLHSSWGGPTGRSLLAGRPPRPHQGSAPAPGGEGWPVPWAHHPDAPRAGPGGNLGGRRVGSTPAPGPCHPRPGPHPAGRGQTRSGVPVESTQVGARNEGSPLPPCVHHAAPARSPSGPPDRGPGAAGHRRGRGGGRRRRAVLRVRAHQLPGERPGDPGRGRGARHPRRVRGPAGGRGSWSPGSPRWAPPGGLGRRRRRRARVRLRHHVVRPPTDLRRGRGCAWAQGLVRFTDAGVGGAAVLLWLVAVGSVCASVYAVAPLPSAQADPPRSRRARGVPGRRRGVPRRHRPGVRFHPERGQAGQGRPGGVRDGHSEDGVTSLRESLCSFTSAHDLVDAWWAKPAGAVPLLAQQLRAVQVVTAEGAASPPWWAAPQARPTSSS